MYESWWEEWADEDGTRRERTSHDEGKCGPGRAGRGENAAEGAAGGTILEIFSWNCRYVAAFPREEDQSEGRGERDVEILCSDVLFWEYVLACQFIMNG